MIRYRILLLAAALALPGAAVAQQRAVVVPAEASVIVPPRGAGPVPAGVAPKTQPRLVSRQRLPAMAPAPPEVSPLLALLPLAAAAVLAATLGGGNGGGVSAPTSTTR
jgi:hypothetical protein